MQIGTIYYIIPNIYTVKFSVRKFLQHIRRGNAINYIQHCINGNHRPVGGVKIHYMHCIQLLEENMSAKPLLMSKYSGNFFGYDLEICHIDEIGFKLNKNDIVVSTEFAPYDGLKFENCIKVMFVQNWINIVKRLKEEDKQKNYLELGYDHVITCGNYNTSQVHENMGIPADTITNGIDQDVFFSDPSLREENRVLCLPRKNTADMVKIQSIVREKFPKVNFVEADGLTQEQIAIEYRKSDIFLATGYPEGLPLPPLEALCSGCMLVGFSGKGGSEYMLHRDTALLVEDGDCEAAADCLIEALSDRQLKEDIRNRGTKLARTYTPDNMKQLLLQFYKKVEQEHS